MGCLGLMCWCGQVWSGVCGRVRGRVGVGVLWRSQCRASTALRCSPAGRAAELTSFASLTAFKQAAADVLTKRAARAALQPALLGATDSAPAGHRLPLNHRFGARKGANRCGFARPLRRVCCSCPGATGGVCKGVSAHARTPLCRHCASNLQPDRHQKSASRKSPRRSPHQKIRMGLSAWHKRQQTARPPHSNIRQHASGPSHEVSPATG